MSKAQSQSEIRDRIKELRRVKASDLLANPANWRRHPEPQRDALSAVLSEIGYADALLARETPEGLMLIDGHLRQSLTPEMLVPVLVLDVDNDEANKLLLMIDPLAALAQSDKEALDSLLHSVSTDSAALQKMLSELAESNGLVPVDEKQTDTSSQLSTNLEYRIIVQCDSENHQAELLAEFESFGLICSPLIS